MIRELEILRGPICVAIRQGEFEVVRMRREIDVRQASMRRAEARASEATTATLRLAPAAARGLALRVDLAG